MVRLRLAASPLVFLTSFTVYFSSVCGLVMTCSSSETNVPSLPLNQLVPHANSYASAHGLQIEKKSDRTDSSYFECAPISLLPNAYPKTAFTRAKNLARPFNELVDRISRDGEFLVTTLGGGVADTDPYTGKLLEMYKDIYLGSSGRKAGQNWGKFARLADRLGIQRSDYMLNSKKGAEYQLKQVELNTIAASFAGLAVNVAALHRHLVSRFHYGVKDFLEFNKKLIVGSTGGTSGDDGVPINPALECLPQAMNIAHEQYKSRFVPEDADIVPVILFIVQDGETNTVDQRLIEFRLWDAHQIPVVRMSLTRAHTELEMDESTGAIYIKPDEASGGSLQQEVSLVYFRAGYAPTDYPDGDGGFEWQAREKIERSRATKCPCLGFHLAGTKKVQQELARPGTLERFFPKSEEQQIVEAMRDSFAGLYSLGDDATDDDVAAVKSALSGMEGQYVLKPQREGGGYNFYGKSLSGKLRENVIESSSGVQLGKELAEFILMERLFPPRQEAALLRSGKVEAFGECISELGCFGTLLASHDGAVLHNEYGGFLLRTKLSSVDEGGVASGFATLSSPYLC